VSVIVGGETFDALVHNAIVPVDRCGILQKSHAANFNVGAGLCTSALSWLCWCLVVDQEVVGIGEVSRVVVLPSTVVVSHLTPKAAVPAPVCSLQESDRDRFCFAAATARVSKSVAGMPAGC
jgi:hypothetical protein